jgi:hypothetical protein
MVTSPPHDTSARLHLGFTPRLTPVRNDLTGLPIAAATKRSRDVTSCDMPSVRHDAINRFFRERPAFAVEVLRDLLDVRLPVGVSAALEEKTFNTRPSLDFHPDAVITVGPPQDPVHGIVMEIQQRKLSSKRRQLPRYAAALWLMLDCPVTVMLVCPDEKVATYYAEPINTNLHDYSFHPAVLGPGTIPAITDPQQAAAHPDLAALAVMAHGERREVAEAFVAGTRQLSREHALQYNEHAHNMSTPAIQNVLEEIMASSTWVVSTPFAREHYGRGEADAILKVLAARGLIISDEARKRINACRDLDLLDIWLRRAIDAETTDEIFR